MLCLEVPRKELPKFFHLGTCLGVPYRRAAYGAHTDLMFQLSHVLGELQVKNCNKSRFMHVIILQFMGFAACRNEGYCPPPNFRLGGQQWFWPPKIWEVYNNSNLVNKEVFKKLTTKLASMKYYGNIVWYLEPAKIFFLFGQIITIIYFLKFCKNIAI